ncbi:MAG: class I SAM-dependent methyltransferase [Bacteroidota bacterium]|nr:class I SAM-dependent methyltransferase [Bacteroidota bacterium]
MKPGCPLCGSEKYTIIYEHLQFPGASLVKCSHCSHIYTLTSYQPANDKLYNDGVYKVVENRDSLFDKILNREYKRVIRKISSFKPLKGSLLDFGCGKGKFGSLANKNGWKVKGVETAPERAEYAKKIYGLEVDTNFFTAGKIFDIDFDVLTLFHVAEHLSQPGNLLKELIGQNVKKDGLVVIEVPNINSLQAKIAGSKWMHLDVPRHISHFTPSRLDQFAGDLGLVCQRTVFFSFHLGVLGMTDSLLKLFGYRRNIIYELKNKRSLVLKLAIVLLLPLAFPLEFFSAMLKRGGIVRKYFIKRKQE